jgi:hypothetical protein
MKQFLITLSMALCVFSAAARPLQPVYFDDPSFDIHSKAMPAEMQSFYERYIYAMEQIEQGAEASDYFVLEGAKAAKEPADEVAPLLGNINFDQGAPYNNKCPYLNGGRAVTGCVATAMAQVMRYYQYPAHGTGTFTYTGGDAGAKTIKLEDYPFDWENILEEYQHGYTTAQADAVATLMLMCGASLNMNYSKDGSSSSITDMDVLLKNHFAYSPDVRTISSINSSNPEETIYYWGEDVVRPELQAGHPLIFAGAPAMGKSGHCFVIDGYMIIEGEYYYHVNWGWGGYGNSYCLLTRLQYEDDNYSGYRLEMVYYIYPATQGIEDVTDGVGVQATKKLVNGAVVIERNNAQYTVLGTRID